MCVSVASFETFGSGSFGGPLGVLKHWGGLGGEAESHQYDTALDFF